MGVAGVFLGCFVRFVGVAVDAAAAAVLPCFFDRGEHAVPDEAWVPACSPHRFLSSPKGSNKMNSWAAIFICECARPIAPSFLLAFIFVFCFSPA